MNEEKLLCKIHDCTVEVYVTEKHNICISINGMMVSHVSSYELDPFQTKTMTLYVVSRLLEFSGKDYGDEPNMECYHMEVRIMEEE